MATQSTVKLNVVDQVVKNCILTYFTIFPTREHVLNHILAGTGGGYSWVHDKSGYKVLSCPRGEYKTRIPWFAQQYPDYKEETEFHEADVDFHNMIINWTNDNIDLVCQRQFHHYTHHLQRPALRTHGTEYCNMHPKNMPSYGEIHPDWRDAIEEFAENTLVRLRQEVVCDPLTNKGSYADWLRRWPEYVVWAPLAEVCAAALLHVVSEETRKQRKEFMDKILADMDEKEKTQ